MADETEQGVKAMNGTVEEVVEGKHGKEVEVQLMLEGLSPQQDMAVRELVKGRGVIAVARRVGVSRVTVYRWMQEAEFVAGMNRWRASVIEEARGRMFAMVGDAVGVVARAVEMGDVRASLAVLGKMGALGPAMVEQRREEEVDAELVARKRELDLRAERVALAKREEEIAAGELRLEWGRKDKVESEKMTLPKLRKLKANVEQWIADDEKKEAKEAAEAMARVVKTSAESAENWSATPISPAPAKVTAPSTVSPPAPTAAKPTASPPGSSRSAPPATAPPAVRRHMGNKPWKQDETDPLDDQFVDVIWVERDL